MALSEQFRLDGRVALVTGSSRGIGRAIALGFAEQGAAVAIHYVGHAAEAELAVAEVRAGGGRAWPVQADLAAEGAPRELYAATKAELGPIDILVLNAAVQVRRPWAEIGREDFDLQLAVNLRASLELIQLAVPPMAERGWGRVLTIGSIQQWRPHPQMLVYSALKHAQVGLVRSLASQVAAQGITVNNLAPGVILTERNREPLADPAYRSEVVAQIPAATLGSPADCTGAALLLCSEAGRYITGADLPVDGGMHL